MNDKDDRKIDPSISAGLCNIWALPLQLPLRTRIGKNVLDHHAMMGLAFVTLYAGLTVSAPVALCSVAYLVSIVCHRVATLRRRFNGTEGHSRYNGYPVFGQILGRKFDEVAIKATVEPLFVASLGVLSAPFGQASMMFFFVGAGCMFASTWLTEMQHRQRVDSMRDAMIEGELFRPSSKRRRW
jgi:hypothetical protein